jgi:hypothetical protein
VCAVCAAWWLVEEPGSPGQKIGRSLSGAWLGVVWWQVGDRWVVGRFGEKGVVVVGWVDGPVS